MAAISSVVWSSWPSNGCLSLPTRRLSLPTRRSSLITCSSGPRSSNSDSENPSDWDTAWQKLKEKKQALESTSGTEIAKVERSPSDVEDKYADIRSGRDVGPSFTKEEERKLKKVATIATNGLKEAYVVTFSSKKCFECGKTGHLAKECFTVNPCYHCGKTNHPPSRCYFKDKKVNNKTQDKGKGKLNLVEHDEDVNQINSMVLVDFEGEYNSMVETKFGDIY